jgi:transcriptional regulator of acetoin/glycerol metabolism
LKLIKGVKVSTMNIGNCQTRSTSGARAGLGGGSNGVPGEIGELPLELQAKLLRVLQMKEARPVSREEAVPVSVRLLASTSRRPDGDGGAGTVQE